MAKPVRGFQVNTVLDRLAVELLSVLSACLTTAPLDRDRLQLAILMTLSRKLYVTNLLYRDFRLDRDTQWYAWTLPDGSTVRIHEQAIVYLHQVLARRPRLARRLRHEPGNMHLLLGHFCRFGPPGQGWEGTEVRRDKGLTAAGEDPGFLDPTALELAAQRQRLGDNYGEVSVRRRGEHGPIWLVREGCVAEVPEEMSLFDVTDATPVPLRSEFVEAHDLQRMLARVLDALNERYMLLRASGLDPETWHDRDEPSIARLREMKQLRKPAEELLRLGIEDEPVAAYRRAFEDLQGEAKSFAGVASFDEFVTSEVGMAILRFSTASLDEPLGSDDDEDWSRSDMLADEAAADPEASTTDRAEAADWVQLLIEDRPDLFDEVMVYFFSEVLGEGRSIHPGSGDPGVLRDAPFRHLIARDHALAGLDDEDLVRELYARSETIIQQGLTHRPYPED